MRESSQGFGILIFICTLMLIGIFTILFSTALIGHSGPTDARFGLSVTPIASRVITDGDTGVNYLIVEHDGIAVTPLLSADGLPLMVDDLNHGDMQAALEAARANMGVE